MIYRALGQDYARIPLDKFEQNNFNFALFHFLKEECFVYLMLIRYNFFIEFNFAGIMWAKATYFVYQYFLVGGFKYITW